VNREAGDVRGAPYRKALGGFEKPKKDASSLEKISDSAEDTWEGAKLTTFACNRTKKVFVGSGKFIQGCYLAGWGSGSQPKPTTEVQRNEGRENSTNKKLRAGCDLKESIKEKKRTRFKERPDIVDQSQENLHITTQGHKLSNHQLKQVFEDLSGGGLQRKRYDKAPSTKSVASKQRNRSENIKQGTAKGKQRTRSKTWKRGQAQTAGLECHRANIPAGKKEE